MLRYLLGRLGYGLLVLWGVVTVVFFLFNLSPGDPVRNLVGENAPQEVVDNIRRKLDLDLPLGTRYLYYLNDLSPLSIYANADSESRLQWEPEAHGGTQLVPLGSDHQLILKTPFLRRSFLSDRSVSDILAEAMPGTFVLAIVSISLALLIGLLLGVYAALHKDSLTDQLILFISALGMAGPSFFVAIIVAWIGAVLWRDAIALPLWPLVVLVIGGLLYRFRDNTGMRFRSSLIWLSTIAVLLLCLIFPRDGANVFLTLPGTGLNMTGSLYSVNAFDGSYLDLRNLILPTITLAIRPLAVIVQLTRSSILDVLTQDYIRTARAKGLPERTVIFRHALRNALNPVITAVSGWFASLLAGAVFVEFVFGWKGLGQELFLAIEKQDMPVVMGGVILIASLFVGISMLVDVAYGWIDPRVRKV
jgi:peptide/nickel transport system permease protein